MSVVLYTMKAWLRSNNISYRRLAEIMKQSPASISQKVNCKTAWSAEDLRLLHDEFGLSADFVLGLDGEAECADVELEVA